MRLLVLTKAVVECLQREKTVFVEVLKYMRSNKYDGIFMFEECHCTSDSELAEFVIKKINSSKLFETLEAMAVEYRNMCTITVMHDSECSIVDNYLRKNCKLNICFINLNGNAYGKYKYANIDQTSDYFSVKLRIYGNKPSPSIIPNSYQLPWMNVEHVGSPTFNSIMHKVHTRFKV